MMLELHNVTIGQQIHSLSLTVNDGQTLSLKGAKGAGKTALLRAVVGLIPIDGGHISIDGELLTPKSAPFFRRQMAYVPQRLLVPEDYDEVPTDYVSLLRRAVESGKQLLVVDEPSGPLSLDDQQTVNNLFREAQERGATVLAVNMVTAQNQVTL